MGAAIPPMRDVRHSEEQHLEVIRLWCQQQGRLDRLVVAAGVISILVLCVWGILL